MNPFLRAPGDGKGEKDPEVQRLTEELAEVARETARLLLRPRYDEAELAELDVRARDLRTRLRALNRSHEREPYEIELRPLETRWNRSVSGG
jgi:hypothetical protein